jgi:hypothetical protein
VGLRIQRSASIGLGLGYFRSVLGPISRPIDFEDLFELDPDGVIAELRLEGPKLLCEGAFLAVPDFRCPARAAECITTRASVGISSWTAT